ncbi:unnamed protein product [Haemonchus placei]|uniref:Loricrin-like n=1 Tax=Haemonchus placei TaxID=6290 RepID=A0A0N4X6S9_HAEPC|nr:unnamed protein product [Haemonchus placei]
MNPSSTTPGYTEDECAEEENSNEIRPMNPSSTTPGCMRKGSTHGSVINEIYPTWPTVNTPGYMEKGSTRTKFVHKITTTTTRSMTTTPGFDESGYSQGKNRPLGKIMVSFTGWPGYGGRGFGRGNNAGDKPRMTPLVSSLEWPGYGGGGCSQGINGLLISLGGRGCGQENNRPLLRLPVSIPGFSGFGACGIYERKKAFDDYDTEILPTHPGGTTPGYTEDRTHNGRYDQGRDGHEILPSYSSGTTPGYTKDRTHNGRYNQGGTDNEIPPRYPSGSTPGYVPKGGLKGGNGWSGYGGRGYGRGKYRPLTRPSGSLSTFSGFGGSGFTREMTIHGGGHFDEIDRLMKKTLGMMLDTLNFGHSSQFRRPFGHW